METLREAGANLGGSDVENGLVKNELSRAREKGDMETLATWQLAGFATDPSST